MGQFYKTSKPQFVDDFMYQPPWELAKEAILAKDKRVNNEISLAGELGKVLNFQTLDFDKSKADSKKLEYTSEIENLVNKIKKDPVNYTKYGSELNTLKEKLAQDYTKGEIADMINTFNGAEAFKKDHEKYKDKEAARYTAGYNSFYSNAQAKREKDGYSNNKGVWSSEQLMESLDFSKGFANYVTKLKPNSKAYATAGTDGRYIYKNKGTNEILSQEEVRNLMIDYVKNVPNAKEYITQTQKIGMGDPTANLLEFADNFAYKRSTKDTSQTVNSYGVQAQGLINSEKMAVFRQNLKDNSTGAVSQEGFAAEQIPLSNLAGNTMGAKLINSTPGLTGRTPISIGYQSLVSAGVLKQKDISVLRTDLKRFEKNEGFGDLQIAFVPQKSLKIDGKPYQVGRTYVMTITQAQKSGLIDSVVPGSEQPFYHNKDFNGVNFKFKTKHKAKGKVKESSDTESVRGSLVQPGSIPGLNRGLQIF